MLGGLKRALGIAAHETRVPHAFKQRGVGRAQRADFGDRGEHEVVRAAPGDCVPRRTELFEGIDGRKQTMRSADTSCPRHAGTGVTSALQQREKPNRLDALWQSVTLRSGTF